MVPRTNSTNWGLGDFEAINPFIPGKHHLVESLDSALQVDVWGFDRGLDPANFPARLTGRAIGLPAQQYKLSAT